MFLTDITDKELISLIYEDILIEGVKATNSLET